MSEIKDISDLELRAQPGLEDMGGKHDEVDDTPSSSVLEAATNPRDASAPTADNVVAMHENVDCDKVPRIPILASATPAPFFDMARVNDQVKIQNAPCRVRSGPFIKDAAYVDNAVPLEYSFGMHQSSAVQGSGQTSLLPNVQLPSARNLAGAGLPSTVSFAGGNVSARGHASTRPTAATGRSSVLPPPSTTAGSSSVVGSARGGSAYASMSARMRAPSIANHHVSAAGVAGPQLGAASIVAVMSAHRVARHALFREGLAQDAVLSGEALPPGHGPRGVNGEADTHEEQGATARLYGGHVPLVVVPSPFPIAPAEASVPPAAVALMAVDVQDAAGPGPGTDLTEEAHQRAGTDDDGGEQPAAVFPVAEAHRAASLAPEAGLPLPLPTASVAGPGPGQEKGQESTASSRTSGTSSGARSGVSHVSQASRKRKSYSRVEQLQSQGAGAGEAHTASASACAAGSVLPTCTLDMDTDLDMGGESAQEMPQTEAGLQATAGELLAEGPAPATVLPPAASASLPGPASLDEEPQGHNGSGHQHAHEPAAMLPVHAPVVAGEGMEAQHAQSLQALDALVAEIQAEAQVAAQFTPPPEAGDGPCPALPMAQPTPAPAAAVETGGHVEDGAQPVAPTAGTDVHADTQGESEGGGEAGVSDYASASQAIMMPPLGQPNPPTPDALVCVEEPVAVAVVGEDSPHAVVSCEDVHLHSTPPTMPTPGMGSSTSQGSGTGVRSQDRPSIHGFATAKVRAPFHPPAKLNPSMQGQVGAGHAVPTAVAIMVTPAHASKGLDAAGAWSTVVKHGHTSSAADIYGDVREADVAGTSGANMFIAAVRAPGLELHSDEPGAVQALTAEKRAALIAQSKKRGFSALKAQQPADPAMTPPVKRVLLASVHDTHDGVEEDAPHATAEDEVEPAVVLPAGPMPAPIVKHAKPLVPRAAASAAPAGGGKKQTTQASANAAMTSMVVDDLGEHLPAAERSRGEDGDVVMETGSCETAAQALAQSAAAARAAVVRKPTKAFALQPKAPIQTVSTGTGKAGRSKAAAAPPSAPSFDDLDGTGPPPSAVKGAECGDEEQGEGTAGASITMTARAMAKAAAALPKPAAKKGLKVGPAAGVKPPPAAGASVPAGKAKPSAGAGSGTSASVAKKAPTKASAGAASKATPPVKQVQPVAASAAMEEDSDDGLGSDSEEE